jgi:hypothetical protein
MMMVNQYEIEQRLHLSLVRYGLNPHEWGIKEKQFRSGYQRVELFNKSENEIRLVGKAIIKKCGDQIVAVWRSMSLSSSSF